MRQISFFLFTMPGSVLPSASPPNFDYISCDLSYDSVMHVPINRRFNSLALRIKEWLDDKEDLEPRESRCKRFDGALKSLTLLKPLLITGKNQSLGNSPERELERVVRLLTGVSS
jgi:hypothetical protein